MAKSEGKKKFRLWRFVRRLLVGSVLTVILTVAVSWILALVFEKDVIRFASDKLNANLHSEIRFESVDLTILKTFPYASLEFKNVSCNEYLPGKKTPDPLFKASYLYLQFNVWDLFSGKYSVKRITLRNADLNLYRDAKGRDNWHIWREDENPSPEKEKFSFRLSAVKLDRVRVNYTDLQSRTFVAMDVKSLYFSGNFTEERYKLSTEAEMTLTRMQWGEASLPRPLSLELNATLQVDNLKKTYKISYGDIRLNKMSVNCEGGFVDMEEGLYAELGFHGKKLDIGEILDLLPQHYSSFRRDYDGKGIVDLQGSLKGFLTGGDLPEFSAQFSGTDVSFTAREENIRASDIKFKGSVDYFPEEGPGKKSRFVLESFSGRLPSSEWYGSFSLTDFRAPQVKLALKAQVDLKELFSFFPVDTLDKIAGRMDADVALEMAMTGPYAKPDLAHASVRGSLMFRDVAMQVKKSPFGFDEVSGRLDFNNHNVSVRELRGFLAGNDFTLNGDALNLLPYLFTPGQDLKVKADLECRNLAAEKFFSGETSSSSSKTAAVLPSHVTLELDARIGKFVFKKFEASDIRGKINLYDKVLSVEGVYMKTLGGSVFLNGVANNRSGKGFRVTCNGNLNGVSVSDFFYRFDNFGQDAIDHEHLKGTLDAFVEFSADFSPELKIDQSSVYLKTDLEINNGELIRFEPLKALAGWVRVEELENIRFAKLKNTIYIRNQTVIIPDMAVYSNALDINVSGEHSFDNTVDYAFNLYLGDVLANKFRLRRRPDKQGEFGELIPDKGRSRIFIRMWGPMSDPHFTYDKASVKQKINQDIEVEKVNVKNILDTEFGLIKNDSLLKNDSYLKQKHEKREKRKKEAEGSDDFEFE